MKVLSLVLTHDSDFSSYLLGSTFRVRVYVDTLDNGRVEVTNNAQVYSLDSDNFLELPNEPNHTFLARAEGSGVIKALYTYGGETFYVSRQFVCYTSFFKENYLTYLFPEYDANNIRSTAKVKALFDTLMDMLDVLYAYNADLKVISNFRYGKSKFLSLLSQNVGFERFDFSQVNTNYEFSENESFRELVANVVDLLSVRGTKLAYQIFFQALGYNLKLEEFWYDQDGNLIEVNSEDDTQSTYYAYSTQGVLIDSTPFPRTDPRLYYGSDKLSVAPQGYLKTYENGVPRYVKVDYVNNKVLTTNSGNNYVNNKSNYVRVTVTESLNSEVYESPSNFSLEKRLAIKKYLQFLRPLHVQYVDESFGYNLGTEVLQSLDDSFHYAQLILKSFSDEYLEQILEKFISSTVKNINDELYAKNKWDRKFKWDSGLKYDYKTHLVEEFRVTTL